MTLNVLEHVPQDALGPVACVRCGGGLPPRSERGGQPRKFCSDRCRKADHRLSLIAGAARASIPGLRERLDAALFGADAAIRLLHYSALPEEETMVAPDPKTGDPERAAAGAVDRLRAAVREYRSALADAARHPAGAADADDEEEW